MTTRTKCLSGAPGERPERSQSQPTGTNHLSAAMFASPAPPGGWKDAGGALLAARGKCARASPLTMTGQAELGDGLFVPRIGLFKIDIAALETAARGE